MLLKVAHHGSASGTAADLLGTVHPRYAATPIGARNVYAYPSCEVLRTPPAGRSEKSSAPKRIAQSALTSTAESVTPDVALIH